MGNGKSLRTVGLFAGIGGIELGLSRSGHDPRLLCEIDPAASSVLKAKFPDVPVVGDIRQLGELPDCDVVSAGFPCQDLSQCGKTNGIQGERSSLVREVFRLISRSKSKPKWILLENVPFMLRLDRGRAMTLIAEELRALGYRWAYRTIDARAFGVPQRRERIVLLASPDEDPKAVLFSKRFSDLSQPDDASAFGFYWTEGTKGLGWAIDCVPTLKGGSTLGIPSPPAVWLPRERRIATIDIRDAERLQGFPPNWTKSAVSDGRRQGFRWRLVGNAVCTRLSEWIGHRLSNPSSQSCEVGELISSTGPWPKAACGDGIEVREIVANTRPVRRKEQPLLDFLKYAMPSLSQRATAGFLSRAKKSRLRFAHGFLDDVAHHLAEVS